MTGLLASVDRPELHSTFVPRCPECKKDSHGVRGSWLKGSMSLSGR